MAERAADQRTLRLGTRASQLARWQAEWVAGELRRLGHKVELIEIATRGDVERNVAIEEMGTRGVFTKEIQRALLAGDVDLGVHSLKDLPTEPVDGLTIGAMPQRESTADVIVVARSHERRAGSQRVLEVLFEGARVGTGSLRRQAQLSRARPDLQFSDVRGNVDTRLRKLDEGQFDAIVLAEAGLRRLGLADRVTHVLPFDVMLPAVGQGALAIECRADDAVTLAAVQPLEDEATRSAATAERALLSQLRGGCMAPIGALGQVDGAELRLAAIVLSANGVRWIAADGTASADDPEALGHRVADELIRRGASDLIAAARRN